MKVLDLRYNNILSFREIGGFIAQSLQLQQLDLRGNKICSEKQYIYLLKGIKNNISLIDIKVEHDQSFEIEENLEEDISKNNYIAKLIDQNKIDLD